jgi:16S rRNA U516 pseudouridylate synthase RsuA-like enzyme
MRINKYVALATGMSRRSADQVIADGRVLLGGRPAPTGAQVAEGDAVTLDGKPLRVATSVRTVLLHKPVGYVVSRICYQRNYKSANQSAASIRILPVCYY